MIDWGCFNDGMPASMQDMVDKGVCPRCGKERDGFGQCPTGNCGPLLAALEKEEGHD